MGVRYDHDEMMEILTRVYHAQDPEHLVMICTWKEMVALTEYLELRVSCGDDLPFHLFCYVNRELPFDCDIKN